MHHGIDQLFLSSFRIFLHKRKHFDSLVFPTLGLEGRNYSGNMLYRLGFVVFDGYGSLVHSQSLHQQRGSHDHLLPFLQKGTEVRSKVRLALATVDDQHLALLPRRKAELHVSRESGPAETDDSTQFDLLYDCLRVFRNISHEGVGQVDTFLPLVSFNFDFNYCLDVAGQILARADALYGTGYRGMDVGRHKGTGFSNHITGFHLVTRSHHRLCRSTYMLSHSNIHSRSYRESFDLAVAGDLRIRWMHASYGECSSSHCFPPSLLLVLPRLQPHAPSSDAPVPGP